MITLYDTARPVKTRRADHTAKDEAWLIEDNARREAAARDRDYDAAANEALALDRLCLGWVAA